MSSVLQRLAQLGIDLPIVTPPLAAYQPAVHAGEFVYTSGQLPFVAGKLMAVGKVGAGADAVVTTEQAYECARVCALNALAAIHGLVGLDAVIRVVKVVGFVASDLDFSGQPAVVNGASELLGDIFGVAGAHARSAVGVAVLPMDAPVEIELIVEVRV
jgi:enamine deaminase RidA (YjgF/YER057c/UK114 family)